MKINKNDFLSLWTLLKEKTISLKKFKNKEIVTKLKENGAIKIEAISPTRRRVVLLKQKVENYQMLWFAKKYANLQTNIPSLSHLIQLIHKHKKCLEQEGLYLLLKDLS